MSLTAYSYILCLLHHILDEDVCRPLESSCPPQLLQFVIELVYR